LRDTWRRLPLSFAWHAPSRMLTQMSRMHKPGHAGQPQGEAGFSVRRRDVQQHTLAQGSVRQEQNDRSPPTPGAAARRARCWRAAPRPGRRRMARPGPAARARAAPRPPPRRRSWPLRPRRRRRPAWALPWADSALTAAAGCPLSVLATLQSRSAWLERAKHVRAYIYFSVAGLLLPVRKIPRMSRPALPPCLAARPCALGMTAGVHL